MTERAPNRTKAMQAAGEFWVVMCATCHHPGGLHIIDQWEPRVTHCRCCTDCHLYVDGEYGVWSDARTAEAAEAERPPI
jgi:NAD-dependent SIR2 family protein deacetylase